MKMLVWFMKAFSSYGDGDAFYKNAIIYHWKNKIV